MATSEMSEVIQHLRRTVLLHDGAGLTDGQLLEDYISRHDETAVAALVRRHGSMVWGVCRRVLRNHHDAEDAFQAAFLVLVRKAASIVPRQMVANWLYGVAHQTALNARAAAARRKGRERQVTEMPEPAVTEQDLWHDLQPILDEELSHLPDKYRVAIVLCDLGGKTRKEAARQLGVPGGTVAGRLARARRMLAKRLTRRGVTLSGGALAAVLSKQAASAGVLTAVVFSTIKAAGLFATGQAISVNVAGLTEGVLKAMLITKLRSIAAGLLLVAVVGYGVAIRPLTAFLEAQEINKQEKLTNKERPDLSNVLFQAELKTDKERLQGTWKLVQTHKHGKKVDAEDIPIHPHDLVIEGSKVEMKLTKGGGDRGEMELNPAATPKQITMTWLIQWHGIYKLDEDKLTICFNPDNGIRPDGFSTSADSGRVLFVYERVKRQPEKTQGDALQFLQKTQGDAEKLEKRNKAIHDVHDEMRAMQKKAAAAAVAFEYAGAKRLDASGANAGVTYAGAIYQSLSTTTDDLAKVAKWYDRKLAGLIAGQSAGAEGVFGAGGEKDITRRAVSQDGERPELDAIAKRPLSVRSYLVRTKSYTISVVLSRPPGEALTVISLTYMPE
jgi:RNA polymerase sigma factor (sigma-70 family)